MWEAPTVWLGPRPMIVRRCPTLPHPPGCSTIGAVGLSFRVRDGTGRFPHAMTAVTLLPVPPAVGRGWEDLWLQHGRCSDAAVVLLFSLVWFASQRCRRVTGLLVGNHIVDASSLVSLYPSHG